MAKLRVRYTPKLKDSVYYEWEFIFDRDIETEKQFASLEEIVSDVITAIKDAHQKCR